MPFPNRTGRPSKLTTENREKVLGYLRVGATHKMCAHMIGVDEDTFGEWFRTKPDFRREVLAAEEQAKTVLLVALHQKARHGSVQAATWLLERRGGKDFRPPTQRIELDANVTMSVEELPDDALDALVDGRRPALLEAAGGSGERTPKAS